jgi:hypothetical protein
VHSQYSARDSPFQANTGTPAGASGVPDGPTTTAAAASSWVEKMLQDAQRTSAPSAVSVSISTAVWTVMWMEPAMRAPASGWEGPYSSRSAISPGISCSARRIWWRPAVASDRSRTLYRPGTSWNVGSVVMSLHGSRKRGRVGGAAPGGALRGTVRTDHHLVDLARRGPSGPLASPTPCASIVTSGAARLFP